MGERRDVKTCQYGWEADHNCNAWGDPSPFHGCKLTSAHPGECECLCGARRDMTGVPRKEVA